MAAIHDEIDNWLAANLHDELSDTERSALHAHLVDCGACRKTHQELKTMNKILEETVAHEKPDPIGSPNAAADSRVGLPISSACGLCKLPWRLPYCSGLSKSGD